MIEAGGEPATATSLLLGITKAYTTRVGGGPFPTEETGELGEKLRSLAEKDELTGINNRRNIVRILHAEMERARRFDKPLAVALLDGARLMEAMKHRTSHE